MPEYLAPGVYIDEVSSGLRPIEGVSTSNAGFAGGTARGPMDVRLVTSFPEFERPYGGVIDTNISFLPFAVRGFFENGGRRAFVARAYSPDTGQADLGTAAIGDLTLTAIGPGDWPQRVRIWVEENEPTGQNDTRTTFRMTLAYYDTDEDLPENQATPDPDMATSLRRASYVEEFALISNERTRQDFAETVLKSGSNLVRGAFGSTPPGALAATGGTPVPMIGGTVQTTTARPDIQDALNRLGEIDEVNILCAPDQGRDLTIATDLVNQCERLRDRFAVLQGQANFTQPSQFQAVLPVSTFCAVYHPWIRVFDPTVADTVVVPPAGHVAGVYARTDIQRGVHKAPANEALRGLYLREKIGRANV